MIRSAGYCAARLMTSVTDVLSLIDRKRHRAGSAGGRGDEPARCWSRAQLSRGATTTVPRGVQADAAIIPASSRPTSVAVANGAIMGISLLRSRPAPGVDETEPRPFALPACFSARSICNDL